jgi:LacI family transcriptional regulator
MKQIANSAPTIFDVARLAGVSRGTVDRVVYGRGRVSAETKERVRMAIEQLGYAPNPNASSLASKKEYRFACIIPSYKEGDYWEEIYKGFIEAAGSIQFASVTLDIHFYDQTDVQSFRNECSEIIERRPSGVIMNAVFKDAVTEFAHQLQSLAVPYAFVDNKIDEIDYLMYYGVDPYKSGALGAFLLTTRCHVQEVLLVRLIRDSKHKADPNAPRRHGWTDYIKKHFPDCKIHTIFIHPDKPEETMETLEQFFLEHPSVKHVAMTNSRVFLIDEFLEQHPDPDRIVVGFDDLKRNLTSLRKGNIEYLVTRHIPQQSFKLLNNFAECVIKGTSPSRRNNYVHMDILHRSNLDDY